MGSVEIDGWKFQHKETPAVKYTIVSKKWVGDTQWIWHNKSNSDYLVSVTAEMFLKYAEPVPSFFEKNATYRNIHTDSKWTVWHVHKMANGKVAVVQHTNGTPSMFTKLDWDSGYYEKV